MKTIEIEVFEYDELDDRAKEKAREWYIEGMEFDAEYTLDDCKEFLEKVTGFSDVEINYSGFCSQGDGASFTGYWHAKDVKEKSDDFGEVYFNNSFLPVLSDISKKFPVSAGNLSRISHRNSHEYTVTCELENSNSYDDLDENGNEIGVEIPTEVCEEFQEACRHAMHWVYIKLQESYDYQTSEEAMRDNILANEYTFTKEGTRFG